MAPQSAGIHLTCQSAPVNLMASKSWRRGWHNEVLASTWRGPTLGEARLLVIQGHIMLSTMSMSVEMLRAVECGSSGSFCINETVHYRLQGIIDMLTLYVLSPLFALETHTIAVQTAIIDLFSVKLLRHCDRESTDGILKQTDKKTNQQKNTIPCISFPPIPN